MIYLLKRRDMGGRAERDTVTGFVIRAKSEGQARLLASLRAGDEGGAFWLLNLNATCEEIQDPPNAQPLILLRDCFEG